MQRETHLLSAFGSDKEQRNYNIADLFRSFLYLFKEKEEFNSLLPSL